MGDKSAIEWTDATWNPVTGCTKVSPGCKFCYAERIVERGGGDFKRIVLHPERLDQPLRWRKPRRIFVNSMSDLFHEDVPVSFIAEAWNVMASATLDCCRRHRHERECWGGRPHTFQILTKRPERMLRVLTDEMAREAETWPGDAPLSLAFEAGQMPLPNVHLGVSAEDQDRLSERWIHLRDTPAAVRFVSLEPLLGPIFFADSMFMDPDFQKSCMLDWCIIGGESGGSPERALVTRVLRPDGGGREWVPKPQALTWVRSIRDQCQAVGVPFFFKGWGGPTAKSGGRILDGRTWDEYPEVMP